MSSWIPSPPPDSQLGDHDVPREGSHLDGRHIALLVTGGIAAMKAPLLARSLRRQGARVTCLLSDEALRYVTEDTLAWASDSPVVTRLSSRAEHLGDGTRFDAYLVAPATYNTINKVSCGIADGTVTATLASALGRLERGQTKVIVCPTMHGSMHTRILTESLQRLQQLGVNVVPPREEHGKHNLPDEGPIVAAVCRAVSTSPLRGRRILVTGGPVPARLDDVRAVSAMSSGSTAIAIATDLALRGAEVSLVLGAGAIDPPSWLCAWRVSDLREYRELLWRILEQQPHDAAVLAAAVADFEPAEPVPGKRPSDSPWPLELRPAAKVIDALHSERPSLHIVGFKLESGIDHGALMASAQERASRHGACVANHREEYVAREHGSCRHTAWLASPGHEPERLEGKRAIAEGIAHHLERTLSTHRAASA
jgi:phosphopantothenoylcysteine decarboxylase/phosphopantothenate--cysteine ligase